MCIACNWMRFPGLFNLEEKVPPGENPSRRRLLQAGAVLAAASVAPALVTTPADALRPAQRPTSFSATAPSTP